MKYPDLITRRRQAPGDFNDYGEWVPGATSEIDLAANVQPLGLEDVDFVGGPALFSNRMKVYTPFPNTLEAAFEDRDADHVTIDGDQFVVEKSETWRNHHTKALLLRES